uniref:Transmembrane protein n=1 Tax=Globodera rostochiensis TaxID=31243 RepID=A0A914HKH5_GLORO
MLPHQQSATHARVVCTKMHALSPFVSSSQSSARDARPCSRQPTHAPAELHGEEEEEHVKRSPLSVRLSVCRFISAHYIFLYFLNLCAHTRTSTRQHGATVSLNFRPLSHPFWSPSFLCFLIVV